MRRYFKILSLRAWEIVWRPIWGAVVAITTLYTLIQLVAHRVAERLVGIFDALYQWWYVPLGVLVLCILLRASYEEYREIERERNVLREQVKDLRSRTISPHADELRSLCLHLSEELSEFVERRQIWSESMRFWRQSQDAETEEERERLRTEERRAMPRDWALTLKMYNNGYRERVMAVYDVLAQRGWLGPNQHPYVDAPENDVQIQAAAKLLEDVGQKL